VADNKHRADRGEAGLSSFQTGDTQHREGEDRVSAETQAPIVETSWDPYQVWLTRVKQPREQSARKRRQARGVTEQPPVSDLSETARLRALTIVR
jgi:hypothetical protein